MNFVTKIHFCPLFSYSVFKFFVIYVCELYKIKCYLYSV